ncbi:MAG: hypothetical protein KKH98_01725 [Spirochaetes bacterium]|nr:hypothetical protein [Spirochaetota bacterium]
MNRRSIVVLSLILFTQVLYGADPYAFLQYGVGSSGLSKTGIVSSVPTAASFYNPALLVNRADQVMAGYSIPFSENFLLKEGETGIQGIGVYSMGVSYSKEKFGFGLSALMLENSDLIGYDDQGNETGGFSTYEGCISLGYGMQLKKGLNIGVNNKIIYQRLFEGYNRVVATIGAGLEKRLSSRWTLTAVVDNLINYQISGNNIRYESPDRVYGLGAGYHIGRVHLSTTMLSDLEDIIFSTGFNAGVIQWMELFGGVRDTVGYYGYNHEVNALHSLSMMNLGIKLSLKRWSTDYSIGYQGSLGIKHTICGAYRY